MPSNIKENNNEYQQLKNEIEELRLQLEESNDTINAIRSGEVDALIVNNNSKLEVYTLKSADHTYRLFIEKMKEGAITINSKNIIIYSNTRFADIVGVPLSKVIGSSFYEYIPQEQKSICENIISQGWIKENKGEVFLKNYENQQTPFLLSLSTLDLDEATALSIILTDLSVQIENQKLLKDKNFQLEAAQLYTKKLNDKLEATVKERTNDLLMSRDHFKFLSNNIPVIVLTTKINGEVDYFNNRWYEFTGLTTEQSMNNKWEAIVHPEDRHLIKDGWKTALKNGEHYKVEYRLKAAKDGSYKWHFAHALPFKNDTNKIIAWVGTLTDIEEQKMALLKKDEFISLASHELKTPVTSLKAFTQILQIGLQEEGNERAVDLLGRMDKQINKLTYLISDLLDVTKINSGKISFTKEKFDLNTLIEETTEEIQRTSLHHEIQLNLSKNCYILGDKNRIGQVLTNLLSNAIKYSPDSFKIFITTKLINGSVKFCVQDHGIGISLKEQPQLFTRFFRGSDDRVKTFPGLGLGLYICNEIIKRHKGTIDFESQSGKGSTFCVTLPYIKA